ncbi:MAG: dUTP diphosphatase [Desulfobacteraceae bacterium]|nr:dUTP diphosphatase [Desulfobacteraceae bacterium]
MEQFLCRVCGHTEYQKAHGENFYSCAGCSAVFTDPKLFCAPAVKVKFLSGKASMPAKMTPAATAYDLFSARDQTLLPGAVALLATDIALELPPNFEAQVRCRSGMAKQGIQVANGIGSIDADYRGPVGVLLFNSTAKEYRVEKGDRIAQLVIAPAVHFGLERVETLSDTTRGQGGFGHTGR